MLEGQVHAPVGLSLCPAPLLATWAMGRVRHNLCMYPDWHVCKLFICTLACTIWFSSLIGGSLQPKYKIFCNIIHNSAQSIWSHSLTPALAHPPTSGLTLLPTHHLHFLLSCVSCVDWFKICPLPGLNCPVCQGHARTCLLDMVVRFSYCPRLGSTQPTTLTGSPAYVRSDSYASCQREWARPPWRQTRKRPRATSHCWHDPMPM